MGATVVLVARDTERGQHTCEQLRTCSVNHRVDWMQADLSSMRSIRALAGRFKSRYDRLHVLINCAGAIFKQRRRSPEDIELTLALNHLAYFALTVELLQHLRASQPARIVNVASEAHRPNRLDFEDLESQKHYSGYALDLLRATVYGRTKLANILFTYELARRLEGTGVTANCLHPGFIASNFGRNNPGVLTWVFKLLRPLLESPRAGAETVVHLATAPDLRDVSGQYFIKKKAVRSSPASYDRAAAKRLGDVSREMIARTCGDR